MGGESDFSKYLNPTFFIDSDKPAVIRFAEEASAGEKSSLGKAVALYHAVRDGFYYDPYRVEMEREAMTGEYVLNTGRGYCITKAVLLAAGARALGIPARLGFANVRNHLSTERLKKMMQTDVFAWHGYTEMFLEGKWVKATPAFNLSLCEKFGVKPLTFDGKSDSIFHEFDQNGNRHMEYLTDHGVFDDLPFERIRRGFMEFYPVLLNNASRDSGDFAGEASAETCSP